jgi:hypothetical protein
MGAQGYAEDPEAARVWTSIIRPLLARSPGLRTMLSQQIIDGPVQTPAGIVLPDRIAIRFSAPRIVRVVRRIVRGLLWHHYRHVPASNIELVVFQEQIVHPEVADTLNTRTVLSGVGDTIFRYRHGVASDAPDTSVWALQFYAQTQFIIIVQGESFVSAERESRVTEQLA